MNVLDKLTAVLRRREERKIKAATDFDDLIVQLADGKDISPELLDETLETAGKTPEELEQAVKLVLQRRDWAKQLEAEPKVRARSVEVEQLIEKEKAKFIESRAAYEKRHQGLFDESMKLMNELNRLADVRGKLNLSCDDSLNRQDTVIGKQIYKAQEEIRELEIQIREAAANTLHFLENKRIENDEPLLDLTRKIDFRNLPDWKEGVKRLLVDKELPPKASKEPHFHSFLRRLEKIDSNERLIESLKGQQESIATQRMVVE